MTLSEVERVALSQGLHPDDLLAGDFPEEPPRPEVLGRLFGKEDALEVQVAWRLWCARLALEVAEASRILQHYRDRCGHLERQPRAPESPGHLHLQRVFFAKKPPERFRPGRLLRKISGQQVVRMQALAQGHALDLRERHGLRRDHRIDHVLLFGTGRIALDDRGAKAWKADQVDVGDARQDGALDRLDQLRRGAIRSQIGRAIAHPQLGVLIFGILQKLQVGRVLIAPFWY